MMNTYLISKKTWSDVRGEISSLNPELTKIIDTLDIPKDCYFYECAYPFGSHILKNGFFNIATTDGETVPITDENIPKEIRNDLSYNFHANPASISLEKPMELYVVIDGTIIPSYLVKPGNLFGLSIIVEQKIKPHTYVGGSVWEMTAGSRCCFLLPTIRDTNGLNKLQRHFDISINKPNSLYDHWLNLKEISRESDWRCRTLFLSKSWAKHIHNPGWEPLKIYLLQTLRDLQNFWANLFPWNVAFSHISHSKNIKQSWLARDIVKNIFAVGAGQLSGFQPAINDDFLPATFIEKAYVDIYELREYQPIIMHSNTLTLGNKNPIYVSLQFPTTESAYEYKNIQSSLKLIDDARHIYVKHMSHINGTMANLDAPYIHEVAETKEASFYHSQANTKYGRILPADSLSKMTDFDYFNSKYPKRKFPHNAKFFTGCARIEGKN